MVEIKEDQNCYATIVQKKLLLDFSNNEMIRDTFFLTGGTALSVFYLHHRVSDDIDLFSTEDTGLGSLDNYINRNYQSDAVKINSSKYFLSYLINNVRVDFVIDHLSNKISREKFSWNDNYILIDNLQNISSNKLCTLVSRSEPKDFIDLYFLNKVYNFDLKNIYEEAKLKDGIFDDVPTVAFQIETNFKFVNSNKKLFPNLLLKVDEKDFQNYYTQLVSDISNLINL